MGYTPPMLEVRKVAGGWKVYGSSTTAGDDLYIYPNVTDVYPAITMLGGNYMSFQGASVKVAHTTGAEYLEIKYADPDITLGGQINDKNIFLNPAGTGKVKFGTKTADAVDHVTDGYVTILDSIGNTVKLLTRA
jgi:hypothetical protein